MGLTRTLLNEMVWPAFKAAKSYVKPRTIEAVQRGAFGRFATIIKGSEDLANATWKRIRDSVWQFNEELKTLRLSGRYTKGIEINPASLSPESTGVHELGHHIYADVLEPKHQKAWRNAVKEYGRPMFDSESDVSPLIGWSGPRTYRETVKSLVDLRGHPRLRTPQFSYRTEMQRSVGKKFKVSMNREGTELGEHFISNTESLAFALQEVLTPGMEITTPVGMLRAIERIFDARGLIDRVAHRLPPLRRV